MTNRGRHLFAAANNFWPGISDLSHANILAYGSKNTVLCYDINANEYVTTFPLRQRVVCVRWSPRENSNLLCILESVMLVKDVDGKNAYYIEIYDTDSKGRLSCAEWSPHNPELVAAGTENGYLCLWSLNHDDKKTQVKFLQVLRHSQFRSGDGGASGINIIRFAPDIADQHIVVLGYRSGSVLGYNVKEERIYWQISNEHRDAISGIAFSPKLEPEHQFKDSHGSTSSYYVCTGSRDGKLAVWLFGKDHTPRYPCRHVRFTDSRGQPNRRAADLNFVPLIWSSVRPTEIISANSKNELVAVHFDAETHTKHYFTNLSSPLRKRVFSLSSVGNLLVAVAMDRTITVWDMSTHKMKLSITGLTAPVYALQFCPLDSGVLIGASAESCPIFSWNLNDLQPFAVSSYWNKILNEKKSNVTTICWNPTDAHEIFFGTSEGKIGRLMLEDTASYSHSTAICEQLRFKGSTYRVAFGPGISDLPGYKHLLYVSEFSGSFYVMTPDTWQFVLLNSRLNFKQLDSYNVLAFRWTRDYSLLAITVQTGDIEIYKYDVGNSAFQYLTSFNPEPEGRMKCIYYEWHPRDPKLALGTPLGHVYIYNLSDVLEKGAHDNSPSPIRFDFQCSRIFSVVWEPRGVQFAVGGSDGSVQIIDSESRQAVANFRSAISSSNKMKAHKVNAIVWSPLDRDLVYTAVDDSSVMVWRISEQVHKLPPSAEKLLQSQHVAEVDDDGDKGAVVGVAAKPQSDKEANGINRIDDKEENNSPDAKPVERLKRQKHYLFGDAQRAENRMEVEDMQLLLSVKQAKSTGDSVKAKELLKDKLHLGCYVGEVEARAAISHQAELHREASHTDESVMLSSWTGDLVTTLLRAAEERQLNDLMVALSAQVSHEMWQFCCVRYAEQLANSPHTSDIDKQRAATLLFAIGKAERAIEVLLDAKLFRDAAMLAQSHPDGKAMVKKTLEMWKTNSSGNHLAAAKCLIAMEKYSEAAQLIASGTSGSNATTKALALARELAVFGRETKTSTSPSHHSLVDRLDQQTVIGALQRCDYSGALGVLSDRNEPWQYVISVHGAIVSRLLGVINAALPDQDKISLDEELMEKDLKLRDLVMKEIDKSPTFIHGLWHNWRDRYGLELTSDQIKSLMIETTSNSVMMVLLNSVIKIVVACFDLVADWSGAVQGVVDAVEDIARVNVKLAIELLSLLTVENNPTELTECCSMTLPAKALTLSRSLTLLGQRLTLERECMELKSTIDSDNECPSCKVKMPMTMQKLMLEHSHLERLVTSTCGDLDRKSSLSSKQNESAAWSTQSQADSVSVAPSCDTTLDDNTSCDVQENTVEHTNNTNGETVDVVVVTSGGDSFSTEEEKLEQFLETEINIDVSESKLIETVKELCDYLTSTNKLCKPCTAQILFLREIRLNPLANNLK